MGRRGRALVAATLWALAGLAPAVAGQDKKVDFGAHSVSADARYVAQWVLKSANHGRLPFAIVDKMDARIYVFDASGRLTGVSPALLGQATGDSSAPNVGEHAQDGNVPLDERTTPSGRFRSEPGSNLEGEHIVWIDYSMALAIHRLRPGASQLPREARLASPEPQAHRVSLGCVIVPPAFYDEVVEPLLGRSRGVVYVLPEERPVQEVFNSL